MSRLPPQPSTWLCPLGAAIPEPEPGGGICAPCGLLGGRPPDSIVPTLQDSDYRLCAAQRAALRPRTVDLYRWLLRRYIAPDLGGVQLGKLSTQMTREWRTKLVDAGVSAIQTAKAVPAVADGPASLTRVPRRACLG